MKNKFLSLAVIAVVLAMSADTCYPTEDCSSYADCGGWTTDSSAAPIEVIQLYTCNVCQTAQNCGTECVPGPFVTPTLIVTVQKPDGSVTNYEYGYCYDQATENCPS